MAASKKKYSVTNGFAVFTLEQQWFVDYSIPPSYLHPEEQFFGFITSHTSRSDSIPSRVTPQSLDGRATRPATRGAQSDHVVQEKCVLSYTYSMRLFSQDMARQ